MRKNGLNLRKKLAFKEPKVERKSLVCVKVPSDTLVQRMSSIVSGQVKKYEPLDTRDFVPFEDYDELSIDNMKDACERFYNAQQNTCEILASDRGPSCARNLRK